MIRYRTQHLQNCTYLALLAGRVSSREIHQDPAVPAVQSWRESPAGGPQHAALPVNSSCEAVCAILPGTTNSSFQQPWFQIPTTINEGKEEREIFPTFVKHKICVKQIYIQDGIKSKCQFNILIFKKKFRESLQYFKMGKSSTYTGKWYLIV